MDIAEHPAPVAEPFVVQDIFASGLLRIEMAGPGTFRFVFFVNQVSSTGDPERVIVCRLVVGAEAAQEASRQTLGALSEPRACRECSKLSCH